MRVQSKITAYLLIVVSYVVSGKAALMLALPPGYASAIFPPAGIAVAVAFIGGRKTLPWVFLGSFLLNVWAGYTPSHPIGLTVLAAACIIAIASALQAGIGGSALRRVVGYPVAFDNVRDIFRFLLLTPAICLVSATLSVAGLWQIGVFDTASLPANWFSWWIGDSLGVMVALPMVMVLAGEPHALWRSRMRTVAVPMALLLVFFIAVFLKTNQWEQDESLADFRQFSEQSLSQVRMGLDEQSALLMQLHGLLIHDADGKVSREEFRRFCEDILQRFPMIQALEWAPRISAPQRAGFEAEQRKEIPAFEIRERNPSGKLQRAGGREWFYPVTYVEPLVGNEPALGFDIASNPVRRRALEDASAAGQPVATAPIRLVQAEDQTGMLIMQSVWRNGREAGVVMVVLKVRNFMDKILPPIAGKELYVRLVDDEGQGFMYENLSASSANVLFEKTLDFGMRHYRLQTMPSTVYFSEHRGWQSWGVLAMGTFGTGLLGALFLLGTGYTARVTSQVEERTRELRQSEARFRNTMENAPVGMGITTMDGRFIEVNKALCEILGYGKDEFGKMTIREIIHADDMASSQANIQRLLAGEASSYRMEKRYVRKDGEVIWGQLTVSVERDTSGVPLRMIGQIEDITERRHSAELLRKSAEEIEDLYNHAPCGYHSLDKDGVIQRMNDTELEWLGYAREEVVGKMRISDFFTPASQRAFQRNFPLAKKRGYLRDFENEMMRKDGTILHGLVNSTIVYDEAGEYLTSRSTLFDISERKKTEETLRSLFTALEHGPIAVVITDADAKVLYVSPRFAEVTGYAPAEVMGRNLRLLQSGRISRYAYLEMWSALVEGQAWHGELLSKSKQGREYWEDVHITPVRSPAGAVSNYVLVSADISERKMAEEKMRHLAHYDALTDLPNRLLVDDRLRQALAAARRDKTSAALMFLDLDKFKPINDTQGHAVGDLLLQEAAQRMQSCMRESDTVGRIGGDEFIVLLPEVESGEDAVIVAEKIRHALDQPFFLAGQELYISCSIGVAIYPEHGSDEKALVKSADTAMYYAKEAGRDTVRLFAPGAIGAENKC